MDPAGPATGGRRTGFVRWWLIPTAVVVVSTAIALPLVSADARTPVAVCGAVATLVVAFAAAEAERRGRAAGAPSAEHADHEAAWERRLAAQEAEMIRLAGLLPQAVARLQRGEYAEDVLTDIEAEKSLTPQVRAAHAAALRSVVEAVQNAEDLRVSAERGFVNIARRVQAIIHQQARSLREMEDRHGRRHEFFADLLKLDHGTALVGRLADSIAVLGGDRPGRQWGKAIALYSVLRGGMSRIIDYQRVELHPVAEVAVVGSAVEPLIHAVAELLDNATRYSPPHAKVHLSATEVQSGVAIEIEDGGVGLSEEARERAERMLAEAQAGIDLNDLGETPRLGLAVVGRLAQTYDFRVSLRPSAYGGVRAVLVVPQVLLTTTPATGTAHGIGATSGPRPLRNPTPAPAGIEGSTDARAGLKRSRDRVPPARQAGPQPSPPAHPEPVPGSLPQRRRRTPVAPPAAPAAGGQASGRRTATAAPAGTENGAAASSGVEPGLWLGDFTRGLEGEPQAGDAGAAAEPQEPGGTARGEDEAAGSIRPERSARLRHGDGAPESSNPSSGEED
ncbi:ATP-binding protein [Streptomyces sp. NBC_01808]|uniref:ATP-binding protein n=1 Tax=Streptomyces sp. NBC_01808 TaxID=2975947 RepID=UPI002DD92E31|nr:ATP-binding protein [Streptomyces sp. NBC_01808]WSA42022.1 ATP-binding protein [Streptomyces sp. NBC_01808]